MPTGGEAMLIRVSGPMALYTRPEFKVERVSYDTLTPTAAQGILEAIMWKPQFQWHIKQIQVLAPIRFLSVRRNEVKTGFPTRIGDTLPVLDVTAERIQRHSLVLCDVDYVVEAHVKLTPEARQEGINPIKYTEMFRRRLAKGQYFRVPYLGCREFVATVAPAVDTPPPISEDRILGLIPLRMKFTEQGPEPVFFAAKMVQGVIAVPEWE
jgi:CRISPR-associated protein Cas5d